VVLMLFLASLAMGWHGYDLLWCALSGAPFHPAFGVNLRTTQYFFNYQDLGFIKRGLVGTMLHPFPALTTRVGLALVGWALLLVFALQFWSFFLAATASVAGRGRGILALLCAATPAFLLRLGNDFGRFDVIDLMAALACFSLLWRSRWFLASIPAALAILVHEDFLFFQLPLIVALAATLPGDGKRKPWLSLLALPAAATAAVFLWGRSRLGLDPLIGYFAHNPRYLAAVPGGQVQVEEVAVLARTLRDNFALNGRMFAQKLAWLHLPVILAWFWFAGRHAAHFYRRNGLAKDLLFYAAFCPLLLGLVGFDYYRWVAMAAVNLLLVILLQCRRRAEAGVDPVIDWDGSAKVLTASALLGPIGNTKSFLYLFLFLHQVSPWSFNW